MDKLKLLVRTGFFHIFGSSVLNKIIAFFSNVLLARILTKGEYGVFTAAWNIYAMVLLADGMGIASGVLQFCSEQSGNSEKSRNTFRYGVRFGLMFDALLVILLFLIGTFAPLTIPGESRLVQMLCLLPLFQLSNSLISAYLRAEKRNKDFSQLTVFNTLAMLLFAVPGAFLFQEKGMVLAHYCAYLVTALVGIWKIRGDFKGNKRHSALLTAGEKRSMLSISFTSMCNNGLSELLYQLDIFILGIVAAEETVLASYKIATTIPSALIFIPMALVTYIYPHFAEHRLDTDWCLRHYRKLLLYVGLFNAVISAGLFLVAPLVIYILYGTQYMDAVPVFRILAINYFFAGTFRIISGNLLVTQRKLKFNLLVALVSGAVNIAADWFFIQWWGSTGAALATLLVVIVSSLMSTSYLVYTLKKQKKEAA